jgi:hypothetical protein
MAFSVPHSSGALSSPSIRRRVHHVARADTYHYSGDGEVLPLTFQGTTPIVEAGLRSPTNPRVSGRFEIDIGCDSCLCLGRHFVEAYHVPTNSAAGGGRVGVEEANARGHLPLLQLG